MSNSGKMFVVFLMVALCAVHTYGVCCHPRFCGLGSFETCMDCTDPTPYCGQGPCNIFGCNCDGGCRKGQCPMCYAADTQDIVEASKIRTVDDIFKEADKDDDGFVSESELAMFAKNHKMSERNVTEAFKALDQNKDGRISLSEIDS